MGGVLCHLHKMKNDMAIDILDDDVHSSIFGKNVMKFHASNISSNQDKLITKKCIMK